MSFHVAGCPGLPIAMAAIILIVEMRATARQPNPAMAAQTDRNANLRSVDRART
jgi:hypothetical protein